MKMKLVSIAALVAVTGCGGGGGDGERTESSVDPQAGVAKADQVNTKSSIPAELAEAFGITTSPDGWIKYKVLASDRLTLSGRNMHLVQGVINADGSCTISEQGESAPGSVGHYSEPIASNPTLCQEMMVSGELTKQDVEILKADRQARLGGSLETMQSADTAPAAHLDAGSSLATSTSKAYTGSRWVDPLFIVITALTIDLNWKHSGRSVPSASYVIKPYEFKYDGWSNSGTPHPGFKFGSGYVSVSAHERFTNTDFERLLLTIAAAGGPAAIAAVYAACGFSTAPAVFNHTETIRGNANGSYSWSYSDTKAGGCSNLVHHDSYHGFGTF